MYYKLFLTIVFLCGVPFVSHAALMFSEIAWMGTDEDANNEWIEIYNFDTAPADLTGWTITNGSDLQISLSGTLDPHGVGVLERTDDSSVPSVTALLVYTGALANTGASSALTLTLRDPQGNVADEVVPGDDWTSIGGSNTVPKKTAQRTRMNTWVTAAPTPGAQNAQVSDEEEVPNDNTNEEEEEETGGGQQNVSTAKKSSSGGSSHTFVKSDAVLSLSFMSPRTTYVNEPTTFTAVATGPGPTILSSLVYTWNFGDATTATGKTVTHVFSHPGEYVVVLNAQFGKHNETVRTTIKVLPVSLTLARTKDGDITITNSASEDIDLSGYMLTGTDSFVFPRNSFILKGGTITIDRERLESGARSMVALYDMAKTVVASESIAISPSLARVSGGAAVAMITPTSFTSTAARKEVTPKPLVAAARDTQSPVEQGEVRGASSTFPSITIPVYAAEGDAGNVVKDRGVKSLPYVGLALVIVASVLLLSHTRSREQ